MSKAQNTFAWTWAYHFRSRLSRDSVSDPENDKVDDWINRIDWFRPDEIGWASTFCFILNCRQGSRLTGLGLLGRRFYYALDRRLPVFGHSDIEHAVAVRTRLSFCNCQCVELPNGEIRFTNAKLENSPFSNSTPCNRYEDTYLQMPIKRTRPLLQSQTMTALALS